MQKTPTNSHHMQFEESGSTCQTDNPSTAISESLTNFPLPQELITEILLRLPVKSLLKSKCVSKSWLSLISSRQFIKSHFSRSSMVSEYLNHQLLFTSGYPLYGIKQCSLYSALHEPSTQVSDIEYPSENPDDFPLIIGVVNGLVCLAINKIDLILWNPVLKKYKHLSGSNVSLVPFKSVNYGFGYDESNDDYKVVSLLIANDKGYCETEVNVYSLRNDSWRRIEDLKGFRPTYIAGKYASGKYANGKIYWSGCNVGDSTQLGKIVSLDMVSEMYGELQQPAYEAGDYKWNFTLLNGQPCVLCDYSETKGDLWVMDGAEESWCKVVSIPYEDVNHLTPFFHYGVLCITSKGEIVMENGSNLVVYNSKHKEFKIIELDACTSSYDEVSVYVESLVSPN